MNTNPFTELGIGTPVIKAIKEMGYEAPTKIQIAAIPKILEGGDVAGQAQTGTGKTAAFAIPVLQRIDPAAKHVQVIVMCPTRELAIQVTGEFIKLSKYMGGVNVTPVYGGQPIQRQIRQIKDGAQIVVGTPGRMIDHLQRGTLKLNHLKIVVLDEADEMLNMGFREDIEQILGFSSNDTPKQTIMFSATMSTEIKKIMNRFFNKPEKIYIKGKAPSADGVQQYIVEVRDSVRTEGICRLLDVNNYGLALIFCNTKRTCDTLINEMQSRGYSADVLHGDMTQSARDKVMKKFRQQWIDVLVATDVAARGLDVDDVDVVFNYDIPMDPEYYVHRIGRTGRAGKTGVAYTFVSGRKSRNIRFIENKLNTRIQTIPLPSVRDVEASRRDVLVGEIQKTLEAGGLRDYIEQIEAMASGQYTPIEVAAALLKMRESMILTDKKSVSFQDVKVSDGNGNQEKSGSKSGRKPRKKGSRRGDSTGSRFKSRGADKKSNKRKKKKSKSEVTAEPFYAPFVKKGQAGKSSKRNRKKKGD